MITAIFEIKPMLTVLLTKIHRAHQTHRLAETFWNRLGMRLTHLPIKKSSKYFGDFGEVGEGSKKYSVSINIGVI